LQCNAAGDTDGKGISSGRVGEDTLQQSTAVKHHLQYVAVCCGVLRCVAVCCSVLQCGAVW